MHVLDAQLLDECIMCDLHSIYTQDILTWWIVLFTLHILLHREKYVPEIDGQGATPR